MRNKIIAVILVTVFTAFAFLPAVGAYYSTEQISNQVRGVPNATAATVFLSIGGTDGTKGRILKTDSSGELQVDVLTMPAVTVTGVATEATLTSLNNKVTACNTGAVVVSSGAITETNSGTIAGDTTSIDGKITACNTGAVVVASGAITETNSGTISTNVSTIAGDTTSIDGKITACNTGAVVVASGAITETNSGTIASDTTSIDGKITACNTGAVVVASGAITETNSGTIASDTTAINGKITACNTGAVVVASGAITETNSGTIASDTTSIDGKITACNTGAVVLTNSNAMIGRTGGGDSIVNTGSVASGGNLLAAVADKKHRIFRIFIYGDAGAGTLTLSDGCGVFYMPATGLILDFNPVGQVQGTANTAITATLGAGGNFYATVIYKDE